MWRSLGISQYPIKGWEELQKPKMTESMWYKLVLIVASAHKGEIDEAQVDELVSLISLCERGAHMKPGEHVYLAEEMGVDRWEESVKPPEITYTVECGTMEDYEKDMKSGRIDPDGRAAPPPPPGPPPSKMARPMPSPMPTSPCVICGMNFNSTAYLEEHCRKSSIHRANVNAMGKKYDQEEGPHGFSQ